MPYLTIGYGRRMSGSALGYKNRISQRHPLSCPQTHILNTQRLAMLQTEKEWEKYDKTECIVVAESICGHAGRCMLEDAQILYWYVYSWQ